ncbi:hypothetical protein HPB47_009284 [Ixodes persulcatus]|uniref:Uncharacterized protein n=1 Tax=Ixodes persulcatus TaxID=34615 RepID=A0AC60P2L1_IXOPE|nr:hypothetical protein HPB47_009284 [Ixodes persulcatus]
MKIVGPEAATTAAAIFYSKDNLMGTSISTTTQPRGADPYSPELAEAKAVLFAIESHLRHLEVTQKQHDAKQLYLFTDSQHVIRECKRHGATTCRTIKRIFHTALHLFRVHQTKVFIRWIPGHTGIHGNEAAHDAAARELNSPHPSRVPGESDPSSLNSETADTTYDPVEAMRMHKKEWKHRLKESWNPEPNPIPLNHFKRKEMVILRLIRTGGATTPYMTQKFETIKKRKLNPDYEPPDQRCQLCKGDGTLPKLDHLIWECEALATHRSDA